MIKLEQEQTRTNTNAIGFQGTPWISWAFVWDFLNVLFYKTISSKQNIWDVLYKSSTESRSTLETYSICFCFCLSLFNLDHFNDQDWKRTNMNKHKCNRFPGYSLTQLSLCTRLLECFVLQNNIFETKHLRSLIQSFVWRLNWLER